MARLVVPALVLLVACSKPSGECPPVVSCPKCDAPSNEVPKVHLAVKAACFNNKDDLLFSVIVDAKYTGARAKAPWKDGSRTWWKVRCNKDDRSCDGAHVSLDAFEQGERAGMLSLDPIVGARLTSMQGEVATITWGGMRTFVVDFAEQKVRYSESATDLEGRGESQCGDGF